MKLKLLLLVLALQTAWVLGTVSVQERALATGKIILLETRRVDPRDFLHGDYLILSYNISDVPAKMFSSPVMNNLEEGTKIYVALTPGGNGFYEITRASTNEFTPFPSEVLIAGKSLERDWNATNSIHVGYGIEKYFIAEDTGNHAGKLTAQVAVPASGHARLKQLFLDGRPYAEAVKDRH